MKDHLCPAVQVYRNSTIASFLCAHPSSVRRWHSWDFRIKHNQNTDHIIKYINAVRLQFVSSEVFDERNLIGGGGRNCTKFSKSQRNNTTFSTSSPHPFSLRITVFSSLLCSLYNVLFSFKSQSTKYNRYHGD